MISKSSTPNTIIINKFDTPNTMTVIKLNTPNVRETNETKHQNQKMKQRHKTLSHTIHGHAY